ncbi:hypothetical protein FRB90_012303, partial [Tulasnella sp. 427]
AYLLLGIPPLWLSVIKPRLTSTTISLRWVQDIKWHWVLFVSLVSLASFAPSSLAHFTSRTASLSLIGFSFLLPALLHVTVHTVRSPLSIIYPASAAPTGSGMTESEEALLRKKERSLQRRRFIRRAGWDMAVWFLLLPVAQLVSDLNEVVLSLESKPKKRRHLKTPTIFKKLSLKTAFDGRKSKESPTKPLISKPVPSKETLEKGIVQSAVPFSKKAEPTSPKSDKSSPPVTPSRNTLQLKIPITPMTSPRSIISTISYASASTAVETPEDDLNDDDFSDVWPEEQDDDDKTKIARLTQQNNDMCCKLDTALSEIVLLKTRLNRQASRAPASDVSKSPIIDTTPTAPPTPKSVRFAESVEEYEAPRAEDDSEVVRALCLAQAQITDLETEKKAVEDELEGLCAELLLVEERVKKWEQEAMARLEALEEEVDDQKSEIDYLHDKLREARGQSPRVRDGLDRTLSEKDITTLATPKESTTSVKLGFQDNDSDWDDSSSLDSDSIKMIGSTKPSGSPDQWPSLMNEQFPELPHIGGCLESARGILQRTRKSKTAAPFDQDCELSFQVPLDEAKSPSVKRPSTPMNPTRRAPVREKTALGLSLQLPLATEMRPFSASSRSTSASKLEPIPEIIVHPPSPSVEPRTTPGSVYSEDVAEIVVGRKCSMTSARASVLSA